MRGNLENIDFLDMEGQPHRPVVWLLQEDR